MTINAGKSDRQLALEWWHSLSEQDRRLKFLRWKSVLMHPTNIEYDGAARSSFTIERIWKTTADNAQ